MKSSAGWRRKRTEIIGRSDGKCQECGRQCGQRLNVHHRYYEAGKKNWDYPSETLDGLCSECHGKADELRRQLARAIGGLSSSLATEAPGFMQALALKDGQAKSLKLLSYAHAAGVGRVIGISTDILLERASLCSYVIDKTWGANHWRS